MASSIPKFQALVKVDAFRDLVLEHFKNEIAQGELFDPRDLQRFKEVDDYTRMFIEHGQLSSEFDQDRALKVFHASMSWRKRHHVYNISTSEFPSNYFDRNGIFFYNHDINQYPLLHFVVRTIEKGQEDNEAVKRFITYHFERHVRRHPGQRIVILVDMSSTGLKHLDFDLVKFLIASVQIFYPGLLAYILVFKLPFILNAAWKIIRSWLPAEAEQFIKFVDSKSITEFVHPDQLSIAMGGTDATTYVHVHDPINEAVEDPMNVTHKKKVTFADAGSIDSQSGLIPMDSSVTTDHSLKNESSTHEETAMLDEATYSLSSPSESPPTTTRKSILQKSSMINGHLPDEKVFHGLAIRPFDEIIFERTDSSTSGHTDCVQTLTLTNTGEKTLTFKIKTTSPEKFRVKPGCSLLHPGAFVNVSVYLVKTHCSPASQVHKEKFLIIWTLIGNEWKQTQLIDFWKNVPNSVLYEHRLKCSFNDKQTSVPVVSSSTEPVQIRPTTSTQDPSLSEIQKLLKDSIILQRTIQRESFNEMQQMRYFFILILVLLSLIFFLDIYKYFFSTIGNLKTEL